MWEAYVVQEIHEFLQLRLEIGKPNRYTLPTPWLCVGSENDLPLERAPAGLIISRSAMGIDVSGASGFGNT